MATEIGAYLKRKRLGRHLTLREVEQQTGLKNAYLSQLENGKIAKPSPTVLHKLAGAYEVPYGMLLDMVGYPTEGDEVKLSVQTRVSRELATLSDDEEEKLLEYLQFLRSQKRRK